MSSFETEDSIDRAMEEIFEPQTLAESGREDLEAAREAAVSRVIALNAALERREVAFEQLRTRLDNIEARQETQLAEFAVLLAHAQDELGRFEGKASALSDRLMLLVHALERR